MLLTCILYCEAGPGFFIRTVCKYSMVILIMDIIFVIVCFSLETRWFNFEKAICLSTDVLICLHLSGQVLTCERRRIFSVIGSAENNVCEPELENDFCDVTTFVFSFANHIA